MGVILIMNEFTKEELETLQGYIREINRNYEVTDEMEAIAIKIQNVIDNYCEHLWVRGKCHDCGAERACEHESDGRTYYKNGIKCTDFLVYACSDSPCYLKCKKCGELYR